VTARDALGLRIAGAVLVLAGGAVHLQQWLTIFRDQSVGPMFAADVVASFVVAVALVATDGPASRLATWAGLALSIGSLAALVASRTVGLPGFEATGYDVAEIEAIAVEVAASFVLVAVLVLTRSHAEVGSSAHPASPQAPLGTA
jgi:hypothetical protein